jgi:hypothetical protein
MKANRLVCTFLLLLLAVTVQLPAQQQVSPSGTNETAFPEFSAPWSEARLRASRSRANEAVVDTKRKIGGSILECIFAA